MHDSVQHWVHQQVIKYKLQSQSVLELGSYDVNGSVRQFFDGPYIGIDMQLGPGVDELLSAHDAAEFYGPQSFEVIVCTEMLEHDPNPFRTMLNVKKLLKPEGRLLLTARGNGFKYHNPPDYWRFMPESFELLLEKAGCSKVEIRDDPQVPGVFGHGFRKV